MANWHLTLDFGAWQSLVGHLTEWVQLLLIRKQRRLLHLEHWIVKYPEQWLLVYDRFKLRHQKKWEQEGCFEEIKTQYENVWKGIE